MATLAESNVGLAKPGVFAGLTIGHLEELGVPIAVLAIVVALITPLPSFLLDLLIVLNIMMSTIVMMVSVNVRRPVEFSVFPTLLLLLTLFRLALNVSSARLILLDGSTGSGAAGHVIEAFGTFVVGGNYLIGSVIFLVLIAIQYLVINHGAVRISEVTARFTLDALPGKQMSIDADLNSGLIDENEARRRRKDLAAEAEFYGSMDGASRFTQRDAVASLLITAINIIAGFLIGVFQHGMDLSRALETYTVLTIGDGLVTVIPALMISVSGGLVITRAGADTQLSREVSKQLFGSTQPMFLAGGVLMAFGFFPGLPTIPFVLLGSGLCYGAWQMKKRYLASEMVVPSVPQPTAENLEASLRVEALSVEVGLGLVNLVEGGAQSPLLARIYAIRRQLANQLGYLLPPIKVNDNLNLRHGEYRILLHGAEVSRFEMLPGHELAIPTGAPDHSLPGKPATEPAFGLAAWWIPTSHSDMARRSGYTVIDRISVLGTHLSETIKRHTHELFTRQDAKAFCDRVLPDHPKVVEDLVPKSVSLVTLQKVLQNLLRERVPIRDGVRILEALSEASMTTRNPTLLTEFVRQALRRALVEPFLNAKGELAVYVLSPQLENTLESAVEHAENNSVLTLSPNSLRDVLARISNRIGAKDTSAVLLTNFGARFFLRQIVESNYPNLTVFSHNEIPNPLRLVSLGVIE